MAEMVAPAGTVVTVDAELGAKLARRGWRYTGEVEADPVKRKAGRPKKSD